MYKLNIPLVQFPRGAMEFPICFDLAMAHLFEMRGIDYRIAFKNCWKSNLDENGETISGVFQFPYEDIEKYRSAGIRITKIKMPNDDKIKAIIQDSLIKKKPLLIHFDAYFCRWDPACYGKRHNDHLVFVVGISKNGKVCSVSDPYFKKYKKSIKTRELFRAARFFYEIEFPDSFQFQESPDPCVALTDFSNKLNSFLHALEQRKNLLRLETDLGFACTLYKTLQRGRTSQYFYGLYLTYLFESGINHTAKALSVKLAEADCLWINCLLYIVRGSRSYYSPEELLRHLRVLNSFYKNLILSSSKLVLNSTVPTFVDFEEISLEKYFNCKMFLGDDECEKSDFIENEKLCVTPVCDISKVEAEGKVFSLYPQNEKDNIRCRGQLIECRGVLCKGISLLIVAEWIDATVSIELVLDKGFRYDARIRVADFPKRETHSVNLGEAYDLARWKAFDHVYARIVDIGFPHESLLREIVLPDNSHLHLIALVALK